MTHIAPWHVPLSCRSPTVQQNGALSWHAPPCHPSQQPVCDTSGDYQLFSYSREFCERSHERYTLCGWHAEGQDVCAAYKDWRLCGGCAKTGPGDVHDRLWCGLNPYNYYPLLTKDVPRHTLCDTCNTCARKFLLSVEGGQTSRGKEGFKCLQCAGAFMRGGRVGCWSGPDAEGGGAGDDMFLRGESFSRFMVLSLREAAWSC